MLLKYKSRLSHFGDLSKITPQNDAKNKNKEEIKFQPIPNNMKFRHGYRNIQNRNS